eukprot:2702887-Rhodomonas_salina.1
MIKLARGVPGGLGDWMWPVLSVIPDGHQGMYLDNLEYHLSDESIRRGLPQPLNVEDMEGEEDEGPVERGHPGMPGQTRRPVDSQTRGSVDPGGNVPPDQA